MKHYFVQHGAVLLARWSMFAVPATALLLCVAVVRADGWPASAAGDYDVVGNQAFGVLSITQFSGDVGSQCKPISGLIYGRDRIEGFYCPGSGRIAFARKKGTAADAVTSQFWAGNLSRAGETVRMAGTFYCTPHDNAHGTIGGSLGEYNFAAER